MPKTPLMAELQITQEYLGQANHLVYLAPMWKEFLDADTYAKGPGSLVAKAVDGSLDARGAPHRRSGQHGRDVNWSGHDFAQANWYAFGRLAWDPGLGAGPIADEWIRMTWGQSPDVVATIRSIMLDSREAFVHYTMPLGLHHVIGGDSLRADAREYRSSPGPTGPPPTTTAPTRRASATTARRGAAVPWINTGRHCARNGRIPRPRRRTAAVVFTGCGGTTA